MKPHSGKSTPGRYAATVINVCSLNNLYFSSEVVKTEDLCIERGKVNEAHTLWFGVGSGPRWKLTLFMSALLALSLAAVLGAVL